MISWHDNVIIMKIYFTFVYYEDIFYYIVWYFLLMKFLWNKGYSNIVPYIYKCELKKYHGQISDFNHNKVLLNVDEFCFFPLLFSLNN